MKAPRTKIGTLALVMGVAWALIVLLLGWASGQGGVVQAAEGPGSGRESQVVWADDFSPAWDLGEPAVFTVEYTAIPNIWEIPQYGVTITFPGGSVSGRARFTFTPELSSSVPAPMVPTPYFFYLEGEYVGYTAQQLAELALLGLEVDENQIMGAVSLQDRIVIHLAYDEAALGPILEGTMTVFRRATLVDDWEALGQETSIVNLDTVANEIEIHTRKMQHFGVGGVRWRQVLPRVAKEASGTP